MANDTSSTNNNSAIIAAAINTAGTVGGASLGLRQSKELQEYINKYNEKMWNKTNEYNSPQAQMTRLKEAGLNPSLIYGNSANTGNASSSLQSAGAQIPDYASALGGIGTNFQQSKLLESQTNAINARTAKDVMTTALTKYNAQIAERNPWLNDTAYSSMIDSLILSAQQKAADLQTSVIRSQDAALQLEEREMNVEWLRRNFKSERDQKFKNLGLQGNLMKLQGDAASAGTQKVYKEIDLLKQKYELGTQDIAIKKQIIDSKEFQNDIMRIQRDFLQDGTISTGMYYEFIRELIGSIVDTGGKALIRKK